MIKFFRNIRQRLLANNKFNNNSSPTARYLLYAIGEIVLVVIGILIALQINNWNENRKDLLEEYALYDRISEDLNVDQEKLDSLLSSITEFQIVQFQVYRESTGEANYDPGIEYIQLRWGDRFNPIVRENNNMDIGTIRNDKIRKQINQYFNQEAMTVEALEMSNKLRRGKLRDFLIQHGILNTRVLYAIPDAKFAPLRHLDFIKYDKLKAQYGSVELDQILAELRIEMAWTVSKITDLIDANKKLLIELKLKK